MRTKKSDVRSPDDMLEFRVVARHGVILSRVNRSQLKRVQDARAGLELVRADASRIGLFEVSLAPESVRRDWSAVPSPVSQNPKRSSDPSSDRAAVEPLAQWKLA